MQHNSDPPDCNASLIGAALLVPLVYAPHSHHEFAPFSQVRKWIRNLAALEQAQPTAKLVQHRPRLLYDSEAENVVSATTLPHRSEQPKASISRPLQVSAPPVVAWFVGHVASPILIAAATPSPRAHSNCALELAAGRLLEDDWAETMRVASDLLSLTRG